jgi:hypothetical protein
MSSQWCLVLSLSNQNFECISDLLCARYLPYPSQVTGVIMKQFSPAPSQFQPLTSKYSPKLRVLKYPFPFM